MAQNKTAFDDRPIEVQELTQVIKADLAKLNAQISDLQGYQKMRKAGGYTVGTNKSAEEHSSQVVVSLQTRLKDVGVSFTNVLENRSQSLRAQKDRREQFSATNIMMPRTNDNIRLLIPLHAFLSPTIPNITTEKSPEFGQGRCLIACVHRNALLSDGRPSTVTVDEYGLRHGLLREPQCCSTGY